MTDHHPPLGKTWADLQKQGTGKCELCGIALFGWDEDVTRQHCGYCKARLGAAA